MKRFNFWRSLFFSALAVVAFGACSDDDDNGGGDIEASITVNGAKSATLGIKGEGGDTEAVSVVSSGAWTLTFDADQDWCVPSATSGKGGTSTLTFAVAPMPEDIEERSVVATLTTPGQIFGVTYEETATISIRQSSSGSATPDTNVAAIRALLVAMNPTSTKTAVTEELAAMTITGVVGSEASGVNMGDVYYAAVQDDTQEKNSGLTLSCNAFSTMNLSAGTIVSASLTGAQVQTYGGAVQLLLSSSVEVQTWSGTAPEPIVVTPDVLGDYEAMVVKVENCYPTSNIGLAWYNTDSKGNVNFVTFDGQSFVGYMGSKATIGSTVVPDKSGSLIGIAGDYNGTKQVKPRTVEDIQLTEAIPEPEYKPATIGEIDAEGNYEVKDATVVATYAAGFIMQDATGAMLVFLNAVPEVAVGDVVTVQGTVAAYGGALQFGEGATVEKTGTAEPAADTPVAITADNIEGYMTKPVVTFVKMTGTLVKSGNYYNVTFTFDSKYTGSISSPNADLDLDTFVGNIIDIEGWFVNNGNKGGTGTYFTVVATKVANNTEIPVLTFTTTPKVFVGSNPEPQKIEFTSQNIPSDAIVSFTFDGDDKDKFDVGGQDATSVTIKAVGNNGSSAAYSAKLVASYNGETLAELAVSQNPADIKNYVPFTAAPADWSGEYVVGYPNGTVCSILDVKKAASSTTFFTRIDLEAPAFDGTNIVYDALYHTITLAKVEGTDYYTMKYGEEYVGWTSGNNCSFVSTLPTDDTVAKYHWALSFNADSKLIVFTLEAKDGEKDRNFQYNSNSNQERFSVYTGSQKAVMLYQLEE